MDLRGAESLRLRHPGAALARQAGALAPGLSQVPLRDRNDPAKGTCFGAMKLAKLQPGDPITGTSTNSPPSQPPSKAIDNDVTTKYLNFDKLDTRLIITPSGKGPVHALTLISAKDAPERDPSSFVLEGSNDGTNFTRIASNAVPAFPARNYIQSFAVANTNVFNHYRLLFPTVANAGGANSMQIAEVELLSHEEITSPNDSAMILTLPPAPRSCATSSTSLTATWDPTASWKCSLCSTAKPSFISRWQQGPRCSKDSS
jgi:hypothetical protein